MYVIIVHVITVHIIMLCYPIIINVSNIKENTPHTHSQAHAHICTHAHVHADPYHNLNTQGGFVFQPALGYHQLVSYNHNHNIQANADFHLSQGLS